LLPEKLQNVIKHPPLSRHSLRRMKTSIARPDGTYRFPGLSFNVEYEVHAQYKGKISDTETVSKTDDRTQIKIVLRIDLD
jgi:hypothetical protein